MPRPTNWRTRARKLAIESSMPRYIHFHRRSFCGPASRLPSFNPLILTNSDLDSCGDARPRPPSTNWLIAQVRSTCLKRAYIYRQGSLEEGHAKFCLIISNQQHHFRSDGLRKRENASEIRAVSTIKHGFMQSIQYGAGRRSIFGGHPLGGMGLCQRSPSWAHTLPQLQAIAPRAGHGGRPCCPVQRGGRRAGSAAAEKVFEISARTIVLFAWFAIHPSPRYPSLH
jgi:hypothetical protein